jgi:hypothetical protein
MVREKPFYQLWEREPRRLSWRILWYQHRFAVLLGIAVAAGILLGGIVSHPWSHIICTLILLDLVAVRAPARWGGHQAVALVLMHAFGLLAIAVGNAFVEETTVGVYLLFFILLLIFPRRDKG